MATIADVCLPKYKLRSNYYSDTYRAEFTMNGTKKVRDIQHISIPFDPVKQIALQKRFHISDEELPEFYNTFSKNIRHHIKMTDALKNKDDASVDMSTFYYEKAIVFRKENNAGTDFYIVSNPSELLVNSDLIQSGKTTLHNILRLGARLVQSVKTFNDRGFCIGTLDLDSFYITQEEGKSFIKDGYFLYSSDNLL